MSLFFDLLLDKLKLTSYHRRRKKYDIGEYSYICHSTKISPNVKIGKFCSIADDVIIGVGSHPLNTLSTHPFQYARHKVKLTGNILVDKENLLKPSPTGKKTVIGNDVWIGARAIILRDINVGDGAVIGANAVVTKDVPPYAVVAGVPAKIIKYRFPQETIDKLEELKWWDYPKDFIVKLPFANVDKCIEILENSKS